MKPKKIDRSTKKWISLFNERLKNMVDLYGYSAIGDWDKKLGKRTIISAMPDRIKEAEEYADKLYEAMR